MLSIYPIKGYLQEYKYVPFPDSNAIWSEIFYPPLFSGEYPNYERFALPGEDTIINSNTYKKLYLFYDTVFNKNNATYIGGIREDSSKKFYFTGDKIIHDFKPMLEFLDSNNELLLYNFSLNVGDTFRDGNLSKYYEFLVVSEIDTIQVNSAYRKMFYFEPIWWVKWIEGIGNIKGLLFTSGDLPTNGLDNDLICFKQNDTILYFNDEYNDCIPLITSIKTEKIDCLKIKIYPNPATNNIVQFEFGDNNRFSTIEIFNCTGVKVNCIHVNNQSNIVYSTEKYQPGIYFYSATNQKGIKHTGKFVVQ
jgi:hypothetical protein